MPFIYRDVRLDLMSDVVAVQMTLIDPSDAAVGDAFDLPRSLNQKKRVAFIGNAGVGKTTFMRRTLVDFVQSPEDSLFNASEQLVPFYVPLKAVDDSKDYPIMRYLLRNVSYLRGRRGRVRLRRLARAGRVFLMLDGYDEISFAGARSYVREELSILLSRPVRMSLNSIQPRGLAESLRMNRIWLTSRPDFFHEHVPLGLTPTHDAGLDMLGSSVLILSVEGLGPNRAELVKRIFARHEQLGTRLDAGTFLTYVDGTGDDEMRELSYNPLFLTVMCYVYAHQIRQDRVSVARGFDEIVRECIRLLIRDLDEGKARGMSESDRSILLARRNEFTDEKDAFLEYFAGRLFVDNRKLFSMVYLREAAIEYFEASEFATRGQIVDELKARQPDDLAAQLVSSGVFIVANRGQTLVEYDFPHRRFHEVLASAYFENPVQHQVLIDHVGEPQWEELLMFVFPKTAYAGKIIGKLFQLAVQEPSNPYYGRLIDRCFGRRPAYLDAAALIKEFVSARIADGCAFRLPVPVLRWLDNDPEWHEDVLFRFNRTLLLSGREKLQPLAELISAIHRKTLLSALDEFWKAPRREVLEAEPLALLKLSARYNPAFLATLVPILEREPHGIDALAFCIVKYCGDRGQHSREVLECLSNAPKLVFLLRIEREDYALFDSLLNYFKWKRPTPRRRGEDPRSKAALSLPDLTTSPLAYDWFESASA
jgi:hypothetical protein